MAAICYSTNPAYTTVSYNSTSTYDYNNYESTTFSSPKRTDTTTGIQFSQNDSTCGSSIPTSGRVTKINPVVKPEPPIQIKQVFDKVPLNFAKPKHQTFMQIERKQFTSFARMRPQSK